MNRPYRILILLSLLALLSACATTPLAPGCLRIGHDGQFCPLPPAQLPAVSATHLVTIRHDGREDIFMGQLQIDASALRLAGSSLFGTNLFTIGYDGQHITQHPAQTPMHAVLLVTMLELTLADPTALRDRLHGLSLEVSDQHHTQTRELFERGHLIAHIEREDAPLATAHVNITIPLAKLSVQMSPIAASTSQP
ncbi:MAG: DUF3261 domain-containing protein [Gammaproteobacteria bacterium]